MSNYFSGPYSERDGRGGRVGKKDFSIDGRAWSYRDPRNQRLIDSYNQNRERGKIRYNPNSKEKYNALYDYDFGTVRDAAKVLGIGNGNKKREVKQILDYIQGGSKAKAKEEEPAQQSEPKPEPVVQNDPNNTRLKEQQQNYLDTRLDKPGNELPSVAQTNNVYADLEGFAKASNDHYQKKFIPSLKAEAIATGAEIGDSSRFHVDNFDFKVPTLELGGIRKSFEWYRDQINKGKD